MKCPYCGKETEAGSIQSGKSIVWTPYTRKGLMNSSLGVPENGFVLSGMSFTGSGVIAHLCRDCEKIVIDYGDEYSDMNIKRK